jgi:hypothetical protein
MVQESVGKPSMKEPRLYERLGSAFAAHKNEVNAGYFAAKQSMR